jgi:hypothetical protein
MEPGARADEPAESLAVQVTQLNDTEWKVLTALKREFTSQELVMDLWAGRAQEAGLGIEEFHTVAEELNRRKVIGRFSTFLEHVKTLASGERVTKFNALFHWAVPPGLEEAAGRELGRHFIMTHAYWREGGPEFRNVNIMGVAHGTDKAMVLAHKAAIDLHLTEAGIPVGYTNVFWGGRSEIKPSPTATGAAPWGSIRRPWPSEAITAAAAPGAHPLGQAASLHHGSLQRWPIGLGCNPGTDEHGQNQRMPKDKAEDFSLVPMGLC